MKKRKGVFRTQVLGLGVVLSLSACDPVPSKPLTPEQKRVDMDWIYSQFQENYAPLDYKQKKYDFDYSNLKKYYTERAMATKTNDEFYQLMHQFVAEFKDAHTTAALTHGGLKDRAKLAYLGISGRRQGDVFVVTEFLPTYDMKKSSFPIKIGDEISMLDGKPLTAIIREEMIRYEDIGHDGANLTFHMNRIFNRVSTSTPLPTKQDAVLTIVKREYTSDEKSELEEKENRKIGVGEKKTVNLNVTVPWVIKDLFDFRQDQKLAKADAIISEFSDAEADEEENEGEDASFGEEFNIYKGRSNKIAATDVFDLEDEISGGALIFGLRGFDGSIQFPTEMLSRAQRGSKEFHYLNSFFIPNQVESWTVDLGIDEDGTLLDKNASVMDQMKKVRHVPVGARFITKEDATFPTYVTSEKAGNRKKLVATMYLNTFAPKAKQAVVMKEVKETLEALQFYGIRDLVIDMINNGGGSLSLGMQLAQALSNKKVEMPKMQFVLSQTWLDEFENASLNAPSDSEKELSKRVFNQLHAESKSGMRLSSPFSTETLVPFELTPNEKLTRDLNIVVLVNEMCASMCDIFTAIMQDNHMATVVGSKTMGAGGNVVAHYSAPNSHLILRQTESLMIRTNGKNSYLENDGVEPDVAFDVNKSVDQKYRGARQAALNALLNKGNAPAAVLPVQLEQIPQPQPAAAPKSNKGRRGKRGLASNESRQSKFSRVAPDEMK